MVWCANGNWKPLFRKPKSLELHLSFDWLMSQTLGVGFAVRLLQSWFIIIIINAILKYKLWYHKAKVIHLWTVKHQVIFCPKIVIKFGGRHFSGLRRQSVVERQGDAVSTTVCSQWSGAVAELPAPWEVTAPPYPPPCSVTALGSWLCAEPVWGYLDLLYAVFGTCCGLLSPALQVMELWLGQGTSG